MPEQTDSIQPSAARPAGLWILIPLAALTLGGLGVAWMQLDRQADRMRQLEEAHARVAQASGAQLSNLDAAVRQVNLTIEQQGSLLSRVVGTVVPVRVPESTENELVRIESKLAETDMLTVSKDDAATLTREFTTLISSLPPWIQAELLPRIEPVRWQLAALLLIHRELPDDADDLLDLAEELAIHASNHPQATPDVLLEQLQTHEKSVTAKTAEVEEKSALERARKAASGEGDPSASLLELETLADTPERKQLQQELRLAVLDKEVDRIEGDTDLLNRLTDPELKARLAAGIQTAIQDLRITLSSLDIEAPGLTERLLTLTTRSQGQIQAYQAATARDNAVRLRNYQLWALEQVHSVPALDKLESDRVARITSAIDRNVLLSQARKDANAAARDELVKLMIEHLSIIDLRLLDSAVGEWYAKVFSDRFGKLDETRQTRVVEGFANSIKRSMEDLP